MAMRRLALFCLLVGACNFNGPTPQDAVTDIPPFVQFSFPESVTDQAAGMANVRLELSRVSSDTASVDFAIVGDGTAINGMDFALDGGATSGTVTFAAGETVKNIPISILQRLMD